MRRVVDTSILISALLVGGSLPAHLIELWRLGCFDLPTSTDQLDELIRVTRYEEIRLAKALGGSAEVLARVELADDMAQAMKRADQINMKRVATPPQAA